MQGEDQLLLQVRLRSTDHSGWTTAAEALLARAVSLGLSGATSQEGFAGVDQRGAMAEIGRAHV